VLLKYLIPNLTVIISVKIKIYYGYVWMKPPVKIGDEEDVSKGKK
jgi:hypothetical protein